MISGACGLDSEWLEATLEEEERRRKEELSPVHPDRTREVRGSAEAVREVLGDRSQKSDGG